MAESKYYSRGPSGLILPSDRARIGEGMWLGPAPDEESDRRVRESLAPLGDLRVRVRLTSRAGRTPGSDAALDATASEFARDEALPMIDNFLYVAMDHMLAWQLIWSSKVQPSAAHMTLMRGGAEPAIKAMWLMDRSVGPEGRAARLAGALLSDLNYFDKFDFASRTLAGDGSHEQLGPAAASVAELRGRLERERITPAPVPSATALFETYYGLAGVMTYNTLSGFAHGQRWVTVLHDSRPMTKKADGGHTVSLTANDDIAASLTDIVMQWVETGIHHYEHHVGLHEEGESPKSASADASGE